MRDDPASREEHKFDTLSLLAGLSEEDTGRYSIDDILSEFGGWTEKKKDGSASPNASPAPAAAPQPAPDVPPVPPVSHSPAVPKEPDSAIIDQIQHAIDREMELNMATPEPVIEFGEEPPAPEPPAPAPEPEQDFGDPELNALFRDKKIRLVRQDVEQAASARPAAPVRPTPQPKAAPPVPEEPEEDEEAPRERHIKRTTRRKEPQPESGDRTPVPDAAALYKKTGKALRPARSRLTLTVLLTLAAVLLALGNQFGWSDSAIFASSKTASRVLLALMAGCALLSADVLVSGLKGIFTLRFTADSLLTLAFLVTALDAARCGEDQRVPFCAVVCLLFCFASWGSLLRRLGLRRALKPLHKLEGEPAAVDVVDDAWESGRLTAVAPAGDREEHVRGLLAPDLAAERMRVYAPIAAVLSLLLAFLLRSKAECGLTWAWSALMTAALPAACFISCTRPFAVLSGRLAKEGAAVSGWTGTRRLAAARGLTVTDRDVFPPEQVTLGGMKVYGTYTVGQIVGYAAAVIEASGSGLTPLFQELRSTNNGRFFAVSRFRRYEGGGYGAEIGGDVILLGSLRFMQLMGVYMNEGTKVRSAVYLSINGEMCAVFALNYAPSPKVRRGLREVTAAPGLAPVFATRDFLITPLMVEERYKVPNDALEFPSAEERMRLSRLPGDYPAVQAALLTKPGFGPYAGAAAGARLVQRTAETCLRIGIGSGILGLAALFLLTYFGLGTAVTALNLLLFTLVLALPGCVLTGLSGRY